MKNRKQILTIMMITKSEIQEFRSSYGRTFKKDNSNRTPVIVGTEYAKGKFNLGVQFWTDKLIEIGYSFNTDKTKSYFLEQF